MFYNTLNYNSNLESQNRTHHLKTILASVQPDLFMVCEIKNETASNYLFNNAVLPFHRSFNKAPFNQGQSPDNSLLQMVYYNTSKLILESNTVIQTGTRDINHYTFIVNTEIYETNPIKIEVFVTHLKASRGYFNRQKRLSSVDSFIRELDRLPVNSNVLFAGDFNFYTSNEEGFLSLIDEANSIKIIDPINRLCPTFPDDGKDYFDADYNATYFWNNSSFSDVHSQSTRSSALSDGAGGGMDDRFDFIMMSENLKTNKNLFYKNGTYKAFGNNGNCYNSYVSNTSCSGEFSQDLRTALYNFSDHLPIIMELETPKNTLSINKNIVPLTFSSSNIIRDNLSFKILSSLNINKVTIYNNLGQILKELSINNKKETNLHVNSFSKGIYYMKADSYNPIKFVKI
ncbi:MAG: T9SS type A sorting domain-containing protein [Polaribacter sp.]